MIERVYRSALAAEGDGLTVSGYAVPFDVLAEVSDGGRPPYLEVFRRGAFSKMITSAHRIEFRYRHDDDLLAWVGRCTLLREDKQGLFARFRCDDTERGRLAAYKIADGQLPSLSVSFVPGQTEERRDSSGNLVRERLRVKMVDHVAAVPDGAYPMLEPLAVRSAPAVKSSVETWREWRQSLAQH